MGCFSNKLDHKPAKTRLGWFCYTDTVLKISTLYPAQRLTVILFCLLLLSAANLASQTDTLQLEQVEVIADRQTGLFLHSALAMDSSFVASSFNQSLGNLLMRHSNIFLKDYGPGGINTISFRGTAANHTLVLWNDLPLNSPNMGQVDFSTIPIFLVDDVQLLWGGQASSNRVGGIGGVVKVDNYPHFNNGLQVSLAQTAGSFGTLGTYATVGYSNNRIHSTTRLYRRASHNNFEYLNAGILPSRRMKQKNARYEDMGLMQEISLASSNSLLRLISWNQWNNRDLPPIMTNLARGGNPQEKRNDHFSRNMISFKYHYSHTGNIEIKTALLYDFQHYYLRTTSNIGNEVVTLIDSRNNSSSWLNSLIVNQALNRHVDMFVKLYYDLEQAKSDNYNAVKQRNSFAVVNGFRINGFKNFKSHLSLRYDVADGRQMGISPAIELSYSLIANEKLVLGAGFSNNKRLPSLNDLYWYPGGNPELVPEESSTIDISMSHKFSMQHIYWQLKAGVYMSDINNWIQWRPTSYRYWVPANIASVYARGFEWNSVINAQMGKIGCRLTLNYAYTLTTDESPVARIENSAGKQLIYIPKHHGNVNVNMEFKQQYLSWNVSYTGERSTSLNSSTNYTGKLPSYTLNDFGIGKKFRTKQASYAFEIRINNVFNVNYQAVLWRPMPGRNFEGILIFSL
jgi:outer membrane cobalamin receptor